jgi:hypothetical protein
MKNLVTFCIHFWQPAISSKDILSRSSRRRHDILYNNIQNNDTQHSGLVSSLSYLWLELGQRLIIALLLCLNG